MKILCLAPRNRFSKPLSQQKDNMEKARETSGYQRKRAGRGFWYLDPSGEKVSDAEVLQRIKSLAIPPAWKDVWIAIDESSPVQATGRDAKGRQQAIYHPEFRAKRERTKYARLAKFGEALPKIRRQIEKDLRSRGLSKAKVLAAVVQLLECSLIRVGNERYAKENGSFGLTTLRNRHAKTSRKRLVFSFKGKSGKRHEIEVEDHRLARVVSQCRELSRGRLFAYQDEDGETQQVDSKDVNDYLRAASGGEFTAKDFRTWAATVRAVELFRQQQPTTRRLGNTPAVCRSSYILPRVLDSTPRSRWRTCRSVPRNRKYQSGLERLTLQHLLK